MTIVEFTNARLDEREAQANEAVKDTGLNWQTGQHSESVGNDEGGYVACGPWGYMDDGTRYFIAANDPASVLADVAAKRGIVAAAHKAISEAPERGSDFESDWARAKASAYEEVLRLLASPHSDHPDYPR